MGAEVAASLLAVVDAEEEEASVVAAEEEAGADSKPFPSTLNVMSLSTSASWGRDTSSCEYCTSAEQ